MSETALPFEVVVVRTPALHNESRSVLTKMKEQGKTDLRGSWGPARTAREYRRQRRIRSMGSCQS